MAGVNYEIVTNNGVLNLPPGFRFHPTDEELLLQYLRRKVLSFPLPADVIREAEVCKLDPWNLPGNLEEERYFFSTNEVKYPNGNRSNRATASGYWKATGVDKQIVSLRFSQAVGLKKTLVFYHGKAPRGVKTDWIMHEYRLNLPHSVQARVRNNWVICRIFLKKRNGGNNKEEEVADGVVENGPVFYDFLARERAGLNRLPANSGSGSSGITEISAKVEAEDDDYEESSCGNSFGFSFKANSKPSA